MTVNRHRLRRSDDDGAWHELEAALSVAFTALTDAQALADRLDPMERPGSGQGLALGQALAIVLTILDAYLDAPEPGSHPEHERSTPGVTSE